MVPYLDCPHPDQSGITLEYYDDLSKIRFLEDRTSVRLHRHDFMRWCWFSAAAASTFTEIRTFP